MFAVQRFVSAALGPSASDESLQKHLDSDEPAEDESVFSEESKPLPADDQEKTASPALTKESAMDIAFRINLVEAQVILLANPAISTSEAIVLGLKQAVVAQQHATTVQVEKTRHVLV